MKKYCEWPDEKIIHLFRFIENGKKQGKTLSSLFVEYANQTNRMPNSVRNYYYNELAGLSNNDDILEFERRKSAEGLFMADFVADDIGLNWALDGLIA